MSDDPRRIATYDDTGKLPIERIPELPVRVIEGAEGPPGIQGPEGPEGPPGIQGPPGTNASIPTGVIVMWSGLLSAIPAGWVLCNGSNGTPDLRDRFIKGAANAANPGGTGGSATHSHSAHAVTQPSAHADHTLAGAIAGEAAHTHAYTQVPNHVHVERLQGGTTGTTTGTHLMGSAATGGSLRSAATSTLDPTGGVASGTSAAGASHTHGNGTLAVSAHAAHAGTAVDAHSTSNNEPAWFALAFLMKT